LKAGRNAEGRFRWSGLNEKAAPALRIVMGRTRRLTEPSSVIGERLENVRFLDIAPGALVSLADRAGRKIWLSNFRLYPQRITIHNVKLRSASQASNFDH
jgi:hypothetical protein